MLDFFKKKRKKVGLALGGGAARGFAHLGVLKGLVDNNIPIDNIVGVSAGSIVGSLFAAGIPIDDLIEASKKLTWRDFAGIHFSRQGMFSSKPISKLIEKFIGQMTFKELKIPFSALATKLLEGEGVALCDSDMLVSEAVRASASFPGIFAPTIIDDTYYIDGGACANVPAEFVRAMGADVVIAVDVIPHMKLDRVPRHLATIVDRGLDLLLHNVTLQSKISADVFLKPIQEPMHSLNVNKSKRLIELGIMEVNRKLSEIKGFLES